ncbi:MAG: hypothetical protein ACP5IL_09380 [Syntrophobacteraceae bacterium]
MLYHLSYTAVERGFLTQSGLEVNKIWREIFPARLRENSILDFTLPSGPVCI